MPSTTRKRIRKRKRRPAPTVPPPSEQLLVRTSERSSFQTCLHQWQWSYIECRRPIQEAPALSFGNLIHQALEQRYPPGLERGPHPAPVFAKLYKEYTERAYEIGFRDDDGEWQNAGEVGVDMLEHYVEHYGDDEEWEVLASEQTFQVPVFDTCPDCNGTGLSEYMPPKRGVTCSRCSNSGLVYLFTYVGTMDGVWRHVFEGSVRVNDYKTTAKDPVSTARNIGYNGMLSLQSGAYWTFGVDWLQMKGILRPEHMEALDGMIFTYLRKAKRDARETDAEGHSLNKDGSVSKRQPAPYFHREAVYRSEGDRKRYRARAVRQVKRMIELRNGPAEDRIKMPHWMNCQGCRFSDPCELHEQDSPSWEDFLDSSTEKWEPYAAHEIEEENRR